MGFYYILNPPRNLCIICNLCMLLASSNKTGRKFETLKGPRCLILLPDYSNQNMWGMSVYLKDSKFEHTEL